MTLSLSLLCLSACMGGGPHGPSLEDVQEQLDQSGSESAYRPIHAFATLPEVRETWTQAHLSLDTRFRAPDAPGHWPLVLYLPGLGEDAGAGEQWRQAWAAAGYAVLSVQPVNESKALTPLTEADSEDSRWVGHQHFSGQSLERRLTALATALELLKTKARQSGSTYAGVDFSRVAVAGYDLGAQTAAALLGEKIRSPLPDLHETRIQAGILLSPHVDLAAGDISHRYRSMSSPMLVVTGTEDTDPSGMTSASLRPELWKNASGPDQYLVVLENGTHRQMSGNSLETMLNRTESEQKNDEADSILGKLGGGGHRGGGGPPMGNRRADPKQFARQLMAIRSITTAFLDQALSGRESAGLWLKQSAAGVLGKDGSLKKR